MADIPDPYSVEWDERAAKELDALRAFDARAIMTAVQDLRHQAESPTRNRKRLIQAIPGLPARAWQLRIGEHRVFYEVRTPRIVRVLRVILKGRSTTAGTFARSDDDE